MDAKPARSAGVGAAEVEPVITDGASSSGSIVGAAQAIGHISNAGDTLKDTFRVGIHITERALDLRHCSIVSAVDTVGDCAVAGCAGVGVEVELVVANGASSRGSIIGAA